MKFQLIKQSTNNMEFLLDFKKLGKFPPNKPAGFFKGSLEIQLLNQ